MNRTIARTLSALAFLALAASSSLAVDYRCTQSSGCVAHKNENGKLVPTNFRKGDIISTKSGWIVNPEEGWNKAPSKHAKETGL